MSEATIDDLFSGGGGSDPETSHQPREKSWLVRALTVLGIAFLLCVPAFVVLMMLEQTVPPPLLFAASLAVVLAFRLVRKVRPKPIRRHGRHAGDEAPWPDGVLLATSRWDTQLAWCFTDVARYNRRMQPRLADLVDERLRQRHGVTMAGEPDRARQLLGDPLWIFLTGPVKRAPQPRDLDVLVKALEKL